MIVRFSLAVLFFIAAIGQGDADQKRQLEAHEHGHGKLNIAIEGTSVLMELEVPGADIVGFEHAATSDGDKAKIQAAKKTLEAASDLFLPGVNAGCTLEKAQVEVSGQHADDDKGHASHGHKGHEASGKEPGEHSEFHVEYAFKCTNTSLMGAIEFPYFDAFPNAEELDVTVLTDKGQKGYEVNRTSRRIDLQGMM